MKKTILTLFALLSMMHARADEGTWTLYNLPSAVYEQMKGYGYALPYDKLYEADDAIMKAVVNFSGYCSGVVVSPDGLVFTNHHCGFEAIRSHSTVEHDYMLNGFYAKTLEEELPNENMFVSFMVEQRDVTDELLAQGLDSMSLERRSEFLDSVENAMLKEAKAKDSTLRLELKPFYEGNRYYATTYRDFRDVRLVFAIPKSMGKFGGETDNWMWPRQTCDFSVFRIYADPYNNEPANYSMQNVPYHPAHWARLAQDGYKEGDFAMTMGYPGSTSRYLSSYGIEERYVQNDVRQQVRGVKQEVMKRHMDASEAVRIKYDSKYAQSSNYWKNSIGMNKCIDSIGLVQQKRDFEAQLRKWQQETGYYTKELDFTLLEQLYKKRIDIMRAWMLWSETFRNTDNFSNRAMYVHNGARPVGKGKRQHINIKHNGDKWDYDTDREILGTLLKNYREQMAKYPELKKYMPECFTTIDAEYGLDITDAMHLIRQDMRRITDSIDVQEQWLCAAKMRMEEGLPHYSDANFTMRLSYGQVKEYNLGGKPSGWQTKAPSMVAKMKRGETIEDYRVEPEMVTLMTEAGQMPLCFLTTNDITGGNSGSPMFDSQNRLIGLAFDGNWDSLSSDIFFDSQLARCIGVDIRYVLYMMDKWGHADRLLEEMKK